MELTERDGSLVVVSATAKTDSDAPQQQQQQQQEHEQHDGEKGEGRGEGTASATQKNIGKNPPAKAVRESNPELDAIEAATGMPVYRRKVDTTGAMTTAAGGAGAGATTAAANTGMSSGVGSVEGAKPKKKKAQTSLLTFDVED